MNKLVVCEKCKYFIDLASSILKSKDTEFYFKSDIYNTTELSNMFCCIKNLEEEIKVHITPIQKFKKIIYKVDCCSTLNKNNDCEYYKRSWFKW